MLKLIKKIFAKEKNTSVEEVSADNLTVWLEDKLSSLGFNRYLQEYSQQIMELKKQLQQKTGILKVQEISEQDQKQVQDKVKNVVMGHKNHYVNEIERFVRDLGAISDSCKNADSCKKISYYQDILSFNVALDKGLAELSKRTAKSYQAAQHLFFNNVEDIFLSLGKLNRLVKDFEHKVETDKIKGLQKVGDLIVVLQHEIEKNEDLAKQISTRENELAGLYEDKKEAETRLKNLTESEDYNKILMLKENKKSIEQEYKGVEYKIFSFFSKLQKALKKYERVSLENKLINDYLQDSVKTFLHDSEMKIIPLLSGLKKNLDSLRFDEKQKNNFMKMVEKAEKGYLRGLYGKIKSLQKEMKDISLRLENNKIENEIEKIAEDREYLQNKIEKNKTETAELKTKLGKIDLEENKRRLNREVKEVFDVELKVS